MRALVAVAGLVVALPARADGPVRWRDATNAPAMIQVWGRGDEIYGAGPAGVYRSADAGASWTLLDPEPARAVWGIDDEIWIIRKRSLRRARGGRPWVTQALPMLSLTAELDGMWGIGRERYAFGAERFGGRMRGVILHSRDALDPIPGCSRSRVTQSHVRCASVVCSRYSPFVQDHAATARAIWPARFPETRSLQIFGSLDRDTDEAA